MAAVHRLLSQTRRHSPLSSLPWLRRSLCSSPSSSQPDPNPNPSPNETNTFKPQPVSVQPVSYPIKPKDPDERPDPSNTEPRGWSREDVRFVKDFNPVSGVSYPNRVAPLPEDKMMQDGESERRNEEMEAERRRIEAENRVMRRVFRVEEQPVPFPSLLKAEQRVNAKGQKVVHDLKEAVQLVKVVSLSVFC